MKAILLAGIIAAVSVTGNAAAGPDAVLLAQSGVRGMSFDTYIRLQNGMNEGELLQRAGAPDSQVVENFQDDIVKTYYYYATSSDPWITTIKLRGGIIVQIDRVKKF